MEHNTPSGFCQCGCGQRTKQVNYNDNRNGYKKGDYKRYVNHHNNNKNHLKPKICVICGKEFLPQKKSRQDSQVACSVKCRNAHNSLVSMEHRVECLRAKGKGRTYLKQNGRHAHRVIMEQILGRRLQSEEIVHHKDGNKLNNNPSNLQLLRDRKEHSRLHALQMHTKRKKAS